MIRTIQPRLLVVTIALISIFTSCNENTSTTATTPEISTASEPKSEVVNPKATLSDDFKNYWYNGEAEITSYRLEQARYGELREGTAVLVFVTEDFLPDAQVKADNYSKDNTPVLKLNTTKNFITGIYPYSIMQSTFYPVANNQHALKISTSVQEWCGHVYSQLNNRDTFEVTSHSYFQGEADETFNLDKTWTENELWAKLRIDPKSLPVGELELIPSLESVRLNHDPLKAQKANVKLENTSYTITYPELQRTLKINFNPNFPYDILGWEETITSGIGSSAETLTSKATKLESLKSDYWNKKSKSDVNLRETLKLE
ncbi:septum formation inhibitor Maf [Winogradskyella costae]|uniref:septum formation inhibitor Maf n=1 Tax=Winogradskyella costae TaxID=2697008 RepID=UPI0015CE0DE4|nr:septum formation inhibitor Maf [Winogradskyella costae]